MDFEIQGPVSSRAPPWIIDVSVRAVGIKYVDIVFALVTWYVDGNIRVWGFVVDVVDAVSVIII